MAAFSLTTALELYRRLYPKGLTELLYQKSPSFGLIAKKTDFDEEGKFLVWQFSVGGGHSSVFANAKANKSAGSYAKPFITRKKEYALASMDGESMDALKRPDAIAELFKQALDGANYSITRSIAFHGFRNGGGARGKLHATASGVATATVQLESTASMQGFEENMVVEASATNDGSGAVRPGSVTILSVDRINKTLTCTSATANWGAGITGIANGDYLFRQGDYNNVIAGFESWVPTAVPGASPLFFGVDRSRDTRLHGLRYAPTSGTIEEVLTVAAAICTENGAEPDLVFLHPLDHANLSNSMQSKQMVTVRSPSKPEIGYTGFVLHSPAGPMSIIADPMCPRYKAWMLTQSTWEDWSLGESPRILARDGTETLRESDADADELRVGAYLNRVCKNPNANMNITLPTS